MDDNKKTIEALRICGAHNGCDGCPYRGKHAFNDCSDVLYSDAADAIEALQAELERAENRHVIESEMIDEMYGENMRLQAELDHLREQAKIVPYWTSVEVTRCMTF